MRFSAKLLRLLQQDAIAAIQPHQQYFLSSKDYTMQQEQQSLRDERCLQFLGGGCPRLFQVTPQTQPELLFSEIKLLEHRLRKRQYCIGYDTDGPIVMETLWHRCMLPMVTYSVVRSMWYQIRCSSYHVRLNTTHL